MKTYQGHRSWNAWNVSLWISNTESIYNYAMQCLREVNNNKRGVALAARRFMQAYRGQKTPDGATYNHLSVKLCLQEFIED